MVLRFQKTLDNNIYLDLDVTVAYGKPPIKTRKNQNSMLMADGKIFTVDRGLTTVLSEINMRHLNNTQYISFMYFLEEVCNFNEFEFDVLVNGNEDIDLGLGRGVDVLGCKFGLDFKSTDEMAVHRPPDLYHLTVPVYYVK